MNKRKKKSTPTGLEERNLGEEQVAHFMEVNTSKFLTKPFTITVVSYYVLNLI